jgi:hypothetical protein
MLFLWEFIGMKFVTCLAASLSLIKTRSAILLPIFCLSTCEGIDRLIIKLWEGWKCRSAFNQIRWIFSSPDLKAQVSFSDCPSVRPSDVCLLHFYNIDFLSKTVRSIISKVGANHPLVKGIQNCSYEGQPPFPRGDNSKWVKIH